MHSIARCLVCFSLAIFSFPNHQFRAQESQVPTAQHPPFLPPITSNELRGSSVSDFSNSSESNFSSQRRSGNPPSWDAQPTPPSPTEPISLQPHTTQPPVHLATDNFSTNPIPPKRSNPGPSLASESGQSAQFSDQASLPEFAPSIESSTLPYLVPVAESSTIQPASYEQTSEIMFGDLSQARQLMERYQIDNAPDPLPGQPVKLVEMFERTPVAQRRPMTNQYWETHFDWATVLNSRQYFDWLQNLPDPMDRSELALLNSARAVANNRVLADEIQLGKSQSKLQQFVAQGQDDLLPLPSDLPLIQTYETHFTWYESRGRIPASLRGIDAILPKTLELISKRANAVGASRIALNQIRNAYAANPRSLGSVLEAARLWNEAEQSLVSSVVSYNQAVSDYALTITPATKSAEEIVAMLISKPHALMGSTGQRSNFGREANALQSQRANPNLRQPPLSGMDLSPAGFSRRPDSALPANHRSQNPSEPQPATSPSFQPPSQPETQPPVGDRNAFRDDNSFGPPISSRNSNSANEFNSFGRR